MMVRYLLAAIAVSGLAGDRGVAGRRGRAADAERIRAAVRARAGRSSHSSTTFRSRPTLDAAALSTHQAALLRGLRNLGNARRSSRGGLSCHGDRRRSEDRVGRGPRRRAHRSVHRAGARDAVGGDRVQRRPRLQPGRGAARRARFGPGPHRPQRTGHRVFSDPQPVPVQPVGSATPNGWDVQVRNIGFGAPPTTLHITLLSGLDMPTSDEPCCTGTGNPLPCSRNTPAEIECQLGLLTHARFPSMSPSVSARQRRRFSAQQRASPSPRPNGRGRSQSIEQHPDDPDQVHRLRPPSRPRNNTEHNDHGRTHGRAHRHGAQRRATTSRRNRGRGEPRRLRSRGPFPIHQLRRQTPVR